jgi:hypothetical protein
MKDEVEKLAAGRTRWPTQDEFRAAHLERVYWKTQATGVRDRIAAELGLTAPPTCSPRPRWTDDRTREALDWFLKDRSSWPTNSQFEKAGIGSLVDNLRRCGTREKWAKQYGLWPITGPVRWTDENIETALNTFLEGRTTWPKAQEFPQAGLGGLYSTLVRLGALPEWRRKYGLPLARAA